jgi:hypothetical protein
MVMTLKAWATKVGVVKFEDLIHDEFNGDNEYYDLPNNVIYETGTKELLSPIKYYYISPDAFNNLDPENAPID